MAMQRSRVSSAETEILLACCPLQRLAVAWVPSAVQLTCSGCAAVPSRGCKTADMHVLYCCHSAVHLAAGNMSC